MEPVGRVRHEGCELAFAVAGVGPPVLFIQGVGVHGAGWRPQIEGLSDRFRCAWFDNRGMGASQPAGAPVSVELMAEDALAVMDVLEWDAAHLVAHSLGGLVALELALRTRERVRSLALLCTFARGRDAARSRRMMWLGARSRIGTRRMRRHAFLEIVLPPSALAGADRDALAKGLTPTFGHDLADQPPVVNAQLAAMRRYDALPRLAELAGLPALVVSAAHDPIAPPPLGRTLAAGLPGSRYVELSDASHGAPIHAAEAVNRLLLDYLAG